MTTTELPVELEPLAFLLGTWQGVGVGGYPTIEQEFRFGQEVTFRHDGRPFLEYQSRGWLLDDAGELVRPAATEFGYWRPKPDGKLEVVLSHPTGFAEIYVGEITGPKIELRTDVVARTETAKPYTAGHRLYG
ncbi:MAG: FABP family protein, partial [Candidatus Nanopelagicales bacterium]